MHFVTKIRPSIHWWDIIADFFHWKKEKRTQITQGYNHVTYLTENPRYVGQALL